MNRPRPGRIRLQHAYESAACQVFGDEHFGLQQQAGTGQRCRAQAMAVVGAIPTGFAREQDRKIVVIGASGTLGRAVVAELEQGGAHEIIRVGRTQGEHQVDITNADSVAALFDKVGRVDAIVSTAGNLFFGPLSIAFRHLSSRKKVVVNQCLGMMFAIAQKYSVLSLQQRHSLLKHAS